MSETSPDYGPSTTQLWALAWLLGLAAAGCALRLLVYAGEGAPMETGLLVWAVVGVLAGVFSAACTVLVGVKYAEARLSAVHRGASDRG